MVDHIGFLYTIWNFLHSDVAVSILAALFVLSEALASIPAIEANSVFQLVRKFLSRYKRAS